MHALEDTDSITPASPLLHPIPRAAKLLGIGRTSVYELLDEGKLASVHIGRRRLIPDASIKRFLISIGATA